MGTVESWTNFERHNGGTIGARELLRNEIEQLARFTNVRIILTTRRMSENYLPDGFNYVALQGLETENIRDYLTHANYSDTDIAWIEAHTELLDCLRIPLFLCMFACRNKAEKIKPLTRGEILYHFFHRGTPFYSEKGKIKRDYANDVQLKKNADVYNGFYSSNHWISYE